jgi:hypothetical protein
MVELETLMHPTTSSTPPLLTNFENGSIESLSNGQFASLIKRQMADDSFVLVILDCRSGEEVSPVSLF